MKVLGYEVSEMQYASAIERMQRSDFKAADIQKALEDAGVPSMSYKGQCLDVISARVADRIIQQNRKLGKIRFEGSRWFWSKRS